MNSNIYDENIEYSRVNWNKIRNTSFEDKKSLLPFIQKLKFCEQNFFTKPTFIAINSLFDIFKNDDYEGMAIMLLLDGIAPPVICNILYNYISSSNICNKKYLEYSIFSAYFLKLIIFGEADSLDRLLISYLGEDFVKNQV